MIFFYNHIFFHVQIGSANNPSFTGKIYSGFLLSTLEIETRRNEYKKKLIELAKEYSDTNTKCIAYKKMELPWIINEGPQCFIYRKELNIPHKLSEVIEVKKINIDQLSKMALEDPSTATNPKKMTIDDMKILYKHSILGKLF